MQKSSVPPAPSAPDASLRRWARPVFGQIRHPESKSSAEQAVGAEDYKSSLRLRVSAVSLRIDS